MRRPARSWSCGRPWCQPGTAGRRGGVWRIDRHRPAGGTPPCADACAAPLSLSVLSSGLLLWLVAVPLVSAGDPCYHGFELPSDDQRVDRRQVKLEPCAFSPTVTQVAVGATVTFANGPSSPISSPAPNQAWGSRDVEIPPGKTVTYTFDKAGVYPYACALHRGMSGAIIVGDASGDGSGRRGPGRRAARRRTTASTATAGRTSSTDGSSSWPAGRWRMLGGHRRVARRRGAARRAARPSARAGGSRGVWPQAALVRSGGRPSRCSEDRGRGHERDDADRVRAGPCRRCPSSPTMIRTRATMIVRAVGAKFVRSHRQIPGSSEPTTSRLGQANRHRYAELAVHRQPDVRQEVGDGVEDRDQRIDRPGVDQPDHAEDERDPDGDQARRVGLESHRCAVCNARPRGCRLHRRSG